MSENPSGIWPTEYNVLVKPDEIDEKIGNIIMADETRDRKQAMATRGTLVAVSDLAFTYESWPEGARIPQVGDTVIITKAAGVAVDGEDGETYRLLKDKDVAAVVDVNQQPPKPYYDYDRRAALDADIAEANREAADG